MNQRHRLCGLLIAGALLTSTAVAQIPRMIAYQGLLTNPGGQPIPNGNHNFVLKLYDQASGGATLFSETHNNVPVIRGVFNLIIGSATSGGIPPSVPFNNTYWLGVTVDSDPEMTPRIQLVSSPYSFSAIMADSARNIGQNAVGTGNIQNGAVTLGKINTTGAAAGQVIGYNGTSAVWQPLSNLAVTSLNGQTGDQIIEAGSNILVTRNGNKLTITSLNVGTINTISSSDGALSIGNPNGPAVTLAVSPGGITESMIAAGAVTTNKLADGAVTSSKILDGEVRTADLADGNVTNAKLAADAVTSAKIADGSVMTSDLADLNVTNGKLAADAVTTDKIKDGEVKTADIADLNVTNGKLADNAVTTLKIADGQVMTTDLADNSVTTEKILPNAVQTTDIQDGAVTLPKISTSGAGSGQSPTFNGTNLVWGSPSPGGAAGGDLTGLYPNPVIAADAVTSPKIADGTIVNADVNASAAIAYSKLNLTNSIVTNDLTDGSVTNAKVASGIDYAKLINTPTSLPPSGPAGGDLTGTYPNPTIATGVVTTAKLADGAVTSLKIADGSITNSDVNVAAGIVYSKLNLTNSIVTSDLTNGSVTTAKLADSAVTGLKLGTAAVNTAHIADGAVTNAKVASGIDYAKLINTPTSLPPSGPAGGDLTGTYPNPTIAASAVTSAKIADGTIINADVSPTAAIAYSKLALTNSIVTSDLTNGSVTTSKLADSAVSGLKLGTFAVNTNHIADGAVTDAKVANGISYSKLSGAPTSLPPSGAAGGDLTGTYPNPTIAASAVTSAKIADDAITNADVNSAAGIVYSKLNLTNSIQNADIVANAITTSKVANGTVTTSKLADSAVSGLKLLTSAVNTAHIADGAVTDAKVANGISYSKLSGAPTSLPPSGAAGGDLTGTYPNPVIAANAVTSAKIADGTITNADVSAAAAISYSKLNLTGSLQGSDIAAGTFTSTNSHRALGNNDNVARELRLLEPSGSGVNYTAFKAQAQAGDITYTLPNTAPAAANQVLQVQAVAGNNATLSWGTIGGGAILFARTATIANAGNTSYAVQPSDDIIGIDMSAGTNFTVNLTPATTAGEILIIKIEKYNNALLPVLTIQPNGTDKIDGANNLAFGNANGVRRLYSDGAGNWYTW